MGNSPRILTKFMTTLRSLSTIHPPPIPSAEEMSLVDSLPQLSEIDCNTEKMCAVARLLAESADRWNDLSILIRTLKACRVDKQIDILGCEVLVSMHQAFGWEALKEFFGDAMKNDETNLAHQTLLTRLLEMAQEQGNTEITERCEKQREELLRSLLLFDVGQMEWLNESAGDARCRVLERCRLPPARSPPLERNFWIALITQLQKTSSGSPEALNTLVGLCVA
ncbi:hypothetical protein C8R43DRAFT_185754 [Mycena crocata]|nr:hypothetical protein C8R43DRAFT_185754 [Mycena crocata]